MSAMSHSEELHQSAIELETSHPGDAGAKRHAIHPALMALRTLPILFYRYGVIHPSALTD
jgi:hypothetical protein